MKKLLILVFLLCALPLYGQQTIDPRLLPSGVPQQMQVDGVNLPAQPTVNFQTSPTIDPANPSAGIIQHNVIDASITDAKIAGTGITTRSKLPAPICYEDEACTFGGAISIGTAGSFSILGSTSGTITIGRQAAAGTYNFNLPTSAGTSGQPLLSGGGGAAPMTFGTLGLAAGGTNQTSWTAARCVRVNAGGTGLESAAADCGTGGAGAITLIQGTASEIGITGGTGPTATVSLPTLLNLSTKTLSGASPLKFDGATPDGFETTIAVTNPTADRTFTLPNADSVAIQPQACATGFRMTSVSALGVINCDKVVDGITPNLQTGTTYTVVDGDFSKLITFSNVASVAVTLPDPEGAGFDAKWFAHFQNRGLGTVTITPTTSTIDGVASLNLQENQGVLIASDGVNYFTQRGIGGSGVSTLTPNTYSGFLQDFGAASLEIPNSPGATPAATGQIVLDTTLGDTSIHNGTGVKTFVYSTDINIDGFGSVSARNPTNYNAVSIATRNQIGKDANDHIGITHDPTEGPIIDCWVGGTRGNCDRTAKLNANKNFAIKDRNGANLILTKETLGGAYSEMREGTGDPASPVAGYWRIYPKSGGIYAQSPAGVVAGPLGQGNPITQVIQFCATDTAVNDTDYLSLNDCSAEPGGSGNVDGKWMAGYAGIVRETGCNVAAAPGGANSVIITTTKQLAGTVPSGATSTTSMTFTMTTSREGGTTANQVSFAKGDFLGLQKVDSISATASAATKCFMKVEAS